MEESYLYVAVAIFIIYFIFCFAFKPSKITLVYNENINNLNFLNHPYYKQVDENIDTKNLSSVKWLDFIKKKCPSLSEKKSFYPTPWLRNGHFSTFYTSIVSHKGKKLEYKRELLPLTDGGQVALDWYPDLPSKKDSQKNTVVILHGLTGNSQEGYCRASVNRLVKNEKFRVAVFNFRGCGGVKALTPRLYNGGDTRDFREAVEHIHSLSPSTRLFALGFSLGANLLVKYLGEEKENCLFSGAISIANPFDLLDCSNIFLTKFMQRKFYDSTLASGLVNLFSKHSILEGHYTSRKWKGVRGFDRDVVRKLGGFQTVNDYYRWASSDQFVLDIRVPLLILNAADDPISQNLAIPYQECKNNPYILLVTTEDGGHIGWWEGLRPRHWFPSLIQEYFLALSEALELKIHDEFLGKN